MTVDATRSQGDLADEAFVVRGGENTPERFANGSGVQVDAAGRLSGVSVYSADGASVADLALNVPNNQIGVTTVGAIREAGGTVVAAPRRPDDAHCTLNGLTADQASRVFTPTRSNPAPKGWRRR